MTDVRKKEYLFLLTLFMLSHTFLDSIYSLANFLCTWIFQLNQIFVVKSLENLLTYYVSLFMNILEVFATCRAIFFTMNAKLAYWFDVRLYVGTSTLYRYNESDSIVDLCFNL